MNRRFRISFALMGGKNLVSLVLMNAFVYTLHLQVL
jgi:hypothetical protein